MYMLDLSQFEPRDALVEAVRRLDPAYYNPDDGVDGNFTGESLRIPELLEILRKHGVDPRVALLKPVVAHLQKRRSVRSDIDVDTIANMCFGSYFAASIVANRPRIFPSASSLCCGPALRRRPRCNQGRARWFRPRDQATGRPMM